VPDDLLGSTIALIFEALLAQARAETGQES
jgi:hypothetical protein